MNAITKIAAAGFRSLEQRIAQYDWDDVAGNLNAYGCAVLERLLTPNECQSAAALYADDENFRSQVHMARHGFGKGEYKYFRYPLPALLNALRPALYTRVVGVANDWNARMKIAARYPQQAITSSCATKPVSSARPRCCCNMRPATSIACVRICTANSRSHCSSPSCCRSLARTLPAASSW